MITKEEFIKKINLIAKDIRKEYSLTQDDMPKIIGISKKPLVQTEKGRRSLEWTECLAIITIFCRSKILQDSLGGDPREIVQALAFENSKIIYPLVKPESYWWSDLSKKEGFKIQQNIINKHYRLITSKNELIISSFDYEEIIDYLNILLKKKSKCKGSKAKKKIST